MAPAAPAAATTAELTDQGPESEWPNAILLAASDSSDRLRELLDRYPKVPIDASGADGLTALMLAAQTSDCDVVRRLVKHGADVNAVVEIEQKHVTPLWLAIGKNPRVVNTLVEAGARITVRMFSHKAVQDDRALYDTLLVMYKKQMSRGGENHRYTAALAMAAKEDARVFAELLEITDRMWIGLKSDALVHAITKFKDEGDIVKAAEVLLGAGADANAMDTRDDKSALEIAIQRGRVDVARLLLQHHATASVSMLRMASHARNTELYPLLLQAFARQLEQGPPGGGQGALANAASLGGDVWWADLIRTVVQHNKNGDRVAAFAAGSSSCSSSSLTHGMTSPTYFPGSDTVENVEGDGGMDGISRGLLGSAQAVIASAEGALDIPMAVVANSDTKPMAEAVDEVASPMAEAVVVASPKEAAEKKKIVSRIPGTIITETVNGIQKAVIASLGTFGMIRVPRAPKVSQSIILAVILAFILYTWIVRRGDAAM
jgi:ankyrin repeat protein